MSEQYKQLFNILEVFEKNDYQKILMGTKIDSADDVVVINIFNKNDIFNTEFFNNLKSSLTNLIHIEENENEIISVTEYKEGTSFSNYLKENTLSAEKANLLANEYINKINNYDSFNNYFKNIFIDENQIIVKDDHLFFNELIIIDDAIKSITPFNKVTSKITSVLNKINKLTSNSSPRITDFVDELKNDSTKFLSFNSMRSAFEENVISKDAPINNDNSEILSNLGNASLGALAAKSLLDKENTYEVNAEDLSETSSPNTPEINDNLEEIKNDPTQNSSDEKLLTNSNTEDDFDLDKSKNENKLDNSTKEDYANDNIINNDSNEIELDGLNISNINEDSTEERPEKKKTSGIILFALLGLLLAVAIVFILPLFKKDQPPVASYERTSYEDSIKFTNTSKVFGKNNKIVKAVWTVTKGKDVLYTSDKLDELILNFKSDGDYTVSLKVKDANDLWSEAYEENIAYKATDMNPINGDGTDISAEVKEKLDKYSITYDSSGNVIDDYEIFRSGNHSIKLDLTKNKGKSTISLDNISIDKNYIISLWVMSDNTNEIGIDFKGYSDGVSKFSKSISFTPKAENVWEMVQVKVNTSKINKLTITFDSLGSTVWVDDIEMETYK
ncbi:hypothetical protein [Helicovermis profundi]|uniref:Uncharacterized protein n=1 Tax=Helicovermis profundi TaxID=3065157 RepID=A0AAU9E9R6_9FIRM|nr:hypothetical protein HLPR_08880 [Clostridia bacterium S502]